MTTDNTTELLARWEARALNAAPVASMIVNRHIRELREALAAPAVKDSLTAAQPSPAAVERKPLTAHFTPFYLLANCRRICSEEHQHTPNWSIATELFAVGSTTAKRICREAGIDPDAFEVRKVGITAQQGEKT